MHGLQVLRLRAWDRVSSILISRLMLRSLFTWRAARRAVKTRFLAPSTPERTSRRRITLLQRIWGADERFLEAHSARYQSLLREKYLRRAKYLMAEGRTKEAKEDLKVVDGPLSYMLLASLPSGLVKNTRGVRRRVRRLLKLK